jgi:hypothetical protein
MGDVGYDGCEKHEIHDYTLFFIQVILFEACRLSLVLIIYLQVGFSCPCCRLIA